MLETAQDLSCLEEEKEKKREESRVEGSRVKGRGEERRGWGGDGRGKERGMLGSVDKLEPRVRADSGSPKWHLSSAALGWGSPVDNGLSQCLIPEQSQEKQLSRWVSISLYLQAPSFLTYPAKTGTNAATFNHLPSTPVSQEDSLACLPCLPHPPLNICPLVVNPPSLDAPHIYALGLSPISADPNPSYQVTRVTAADTVE